jgi:hypothetical protein
MRDLTDASPATVAAERSRVSREGLGAEILAAQQPDGAWRTPDEPAWATTLFTLQLLRATGIDPADPAVQSAMTRLQEGQRWNDHADGGWDLRLPDYRTLTDNTFFDGEVEPCINGGALAVGAYFQRPCENLLHRLLSEQLKDGGWNCEAPTSKVSSFNTTICVLEGLLEYENTAGATQEITEARHRAEEYLLARSLFRRQSTGEIIDPKFLELAFPPRYRYNILRALDYFRAAKAQPDPRISNAIQLIEGRQLPDGRWPLDRAYDETLTVSIGECPGEPSRWTTLHAMRVLRCIAAKQATVEILSSPPAKNSL